jgi:hypothetical protein
MHGDIPPLPHYVFIAWCLAKHRNNFNFLSLPSPKIPEILGKKHFFGSDNNGLLNAQHKKKSTKGQTYLILRNLSHHIFKEPISLGTSIPVGLLQLQFYNFLAAQY